MKQLSYYAIVLIALVSSCNNTKDVLEPNLNISEMKIIKSTQQHLAKAQIYRWYQLYERELSDVRISNTMDMLSDDIFLKSAAGEMKGKENYPDRLKAYEGWKNAHHVEKIEVSLDDNSNLLLTTNIRYQNIQPNGDKKSYTIHYNTTLKENGNNLPNFNAIEISPTGETDEAFVDAYPENRMKSLMHYWLANMERLDGDVTPFKELLAPNFQLNFSTSSKLNSIEDLEKWLNGTPTQLKESKHIPTNFSMKTIMENEYEVTVSFDWTGTAKDGTKMKATTKHVWYVIDDINKRFAKILKVDVTQTNPLEVIN